MCCWPWRRRLAQAPAPPGVPRTPWGDPDLQGLWTNATITPFERPANLCGKPVLTGTGSRRIREADATRRATPTIAAVEPRPTSGVRTTSSGTTAGRRSSAPGARRWSSDPPDGRVPALTPDGTEQSRRARGGASAQPRRRSGRSQPRRAVHLVADRRSAHGSRRLQQQLPDSAGARLRGDSHRDDPRRAHHSARRPSRMRRRPSASGWETRAAAGMAVRSSSRRRISRTRPIFRGSSAEPDDSSSGSRASTRIHSTTSSRSTIPTSFTRSWTAAVPMTKTDGPDIRVRVPRRELRHDEPAQGRASGRNKVESASRTGGFMRTLLCPALCRS